LAGDGLTAFEEGQLRQGPSLKAWLETLNTQAESTRTGYRIMAGHMLELTGNVKLVDLKVRDVQFALGKLAERLSTRGVRLARMILTQAVRNAKSRRVFQIPEIAYEQRKQWRLRVDLFEYQSIP
jgi:hypothetical protein